MNRFVKRVTGTTEHPDVIPMLLDPKSYYGGHQGRLAPFIITIAVIAVPALVYFGNGLWKVFPLWAYLPIQLIVAIRVVLMIPGQEGKRLPKYKAQLLGKYAATADKVHVKMIHDDGCIEYINGRVAYAVTCFNGTFYDDKRHAVDVERFITSLAGKHDFDVRIFNVTDDTLKGYYDRAVQFGRNDAASNFVQMIDYIRDLVHNHSVVQQMVFTVSGRRSEWKDIKRDIQTTMSSSLVRTFKVAKWLQTPEEVEALINRDTDTVVNLGELLREKYKTGDYGRSRVIALDPTAEELAQTTATPTTKKKAQLDEKVVQAAQGRKVYQRRQK